MREYKPIQLKVTVSNANYFHTIGGRIIHRNVKSDFASVEGMYAGKSYVIDQQKCPIL